jgi:hypothetical protein
VVQISLVKICKILDVKIVRETQPRPCCKLLGKVVAALPPPASAHRAALKERFSSSSSSSSSLSPPPPPPLEARVTIGEWETDLTSGGGGGDDPLSPPPPPLMHTQSRLTRQFKCKKGPFRKREKTLGNYGVAIFAGVDFTAFPGSFLWRRFLSFLPPSRRHGRNNIYQWWELQKPFVCILAKMVFSLHITFSRFLSFILERMHAMHADLTRYRSTRRLRRVSGVISVTSQVALPHPFRRL